MRIQDIQQLLVNLVKSTGTGDLVQLTPGQVITVMLKEIQGDLALLSYKGSTLLAKLEADLNPGDKLKCLVEGEREGQVVLRVLTGGGAASETQALRAVLAKMGLAENDLNLQLVKELIRQEMPLNQDSLRLLSAFTRNANLSSSEAWIPVFMLKQGIPLNGGMFQAVRAAVSDLKFIQSFIIKLEGEVRQLAESAEPGSELARTAEQVLRAIYGFNLKDSGSADNIALKLWSAFRQLNPEAAGGQTATGGQKAGEADTAGFAARQNAGLIARQNAEQGAAVQARPETGQAQIDSAGPSAGRFIDAGAAGGHAIVRPVVVPGGSAGAGAGAGGPAGTGGAEPGKAEQGRAGSGPAEAGRAEPGRAEPGSAVAAGTNAGAGKANPPVAEEKIRQIVQRLLTLADQNRVPLDKESGDALAARINTLFGRGDEGQVNREQNLGPLLEKLATLLRENGHPRHEELKQLTGEITGKLDIIQHLSGRSEQARENTAIIYTMLHFGQQEEPLRLIIRHDHQGSGKKGDFTSCRVEVKLHTPTLGLVRCDVQVRDRDLTLRFELENDRAVRVVEQNTDILTRRLGEMNYRVTMLPARVSLTSEPGLLDGGKTEIPGLFQVNLKI